MRHAYSELLPFCCSVVIYQGHGDRRVITGEDLTQSLCLTRRFFWRHEAAPPGNPTGKAETRDMARTSYQPHVGRVIRPMPDDCVFTGANMYGWGDKWQGCVTASVIFTAAEDRVHINRR